MTYCIGWKTQNTAFIAADTAVTTYGNVSNGSTLPTSSFGEMNFQNRQEHVNEGLLKIFVVDRTIIGFAGNVTTATEIVRLFGQLTSLKTNVLDRLKTAVSSFGPYTAENDVALIAGYVENSTPRLISYNHDQTQCFVEHDQFVQIGSMRSYYPHLSEALVKMFVQKKLSDENMLTAITAVLQNYGIFDQLMKMNVGGAFFGVSVDVKGVHWQDDTSYFIYPPELDRLQYITIIARDGVLAITSSISDDKRIFMNTINTHNPNKWQKKWIPRLKKIFNSGSTIYYVFLCSKDRLITIVKAHNHLTNKYFMITADGKGKFDFSYSPEFRTVLTNPNATRPPNSLPFRINWINT